MSYSVAIPLIAFLLFASFVLGVKYMAQRCRPMRQELFWYKQTFQFKVGYTAGFGNYHLISIDGGNTWYELDPDGDEYQLLHADDVDESSPGLLRQIRAFDGLIRYAEQNGALTFSGNREQDDIQALDGTDLHYSKN